MRLQEQIHELDVPYKKARESAKDIAKTLKIDYRICYDTLVYERSRQRKFEKSMTTNISTEHLELMAAQAAQTAQLSLEMQELISMLTERERYVIEERICRREPLPLEKVGKQVNLSKFGVNYVLEKATKKLYYLIQKDPIRIQASRTA